MLGCCLNKAPWCCLDKTPLPWPGWRSGIPCLGGPGTEAAQPHSPRHCQRAARMQMQDEVHPQTAVDGSSLSCWRCVQPGLPGSAHALTALSQTVNPSNHSYTVTQTTLMPCGHTRQERGRHLQRVHNIGLMCQEIHPADEGGSQAVCTTTHCRPQAVPESINKPEQSEAKNCWYKLVQAGDKTANACKQAVPFKNACRQHQNFAEVHAEELQLHAAASSRWACLPLVKLVYSKPQQANLALA